MGNMHRPTAVAIGDLNGDGKPDLVTATYGSQPSDPPFVGVLLGNGDGFFAAPAYYGTGAFPRSVASGDLNGDDKPDVAAANHGSNTGSVLRGNGDGGSGRHTDYGTAGQPISVAVADLAPDGT